MQPAVWLAGACLLFVGCSGATLSKFPGEEADGGAAPPAAAPEVAEPQADAAAVPRKIIYEAELNLVVDDFTAVVDALPRLVERFDGYLAEASVDRHSGERRFGRWVARIPVDRFEEFLHEVSQLGVPENRRQTAQDVTEEYLDLEARIANKQQLEARVLELLGESSGAIKDVLEVERELARVRSEIEQMQGRLRYLTNRTSLTTVTITAQEQRNYQPPQAPTFLGRIRQTWDDSLHALQVFGETLVLIAVFVVPWLAPPALVAAPVIWWLRARRSNVREK